MTPEIKTLVEQEAERLFPLLPDNAVGWRNWNKVLQIKRHEFIAGATFYEQTVLPKILQEKDKEIARLQMLADRYRKISYELDPKFKQYEGQMSPNDKPTPSSEGKQISYESNTSS